MKNVKALLEQPQSGLNPWAIWIWNLQITKEAAIEQLGDFAAKGFLGVAIRPGRDLQPAYLSHEFLDIFGAVLDAAQKYKLKVRLADDFSMPYNGVFADQLSRDALMRASCIKLDYCEIVDKKGLVQLACSPDEEAIVQMARLTLDGKIDLASLKQIPVTVPHQPLSVTIPDGTWQVMVFKKSFVHDPVCGYLPNPYNPKVAEFYIKDVLTAIKTRFSKFVPAVFEGYITELPAIYYDRTTLFWDEDVIIKYRSRFKKEMVKFLPSFFFDVTAASLVYKEHAIQFLNESLLERTALLLETWSHKVRFSQWLLLAERPVQGLMPVTREYCPIAIGNYSCTGIQNQDGLTETYPLLHATADANTLQTKRSTVMVVGRNRNGTSATLQSLRNEIDAAVFMGADHILIDGCYFNLDPRSSVKTPANPFWYSPEWENASELTRYTSQLRSIAADLHSFRQVAVLMPTPLAIGDERTESSMAKGSILQQVVSELTHKGIDFDIITEAYLFGCIVRQTGEFSPADRGRRGAFKALIVPRPKMVGKDTLAFIEKLAARKGRIFFVGEAPCGTAEVGPSATTEQRMDRLLGAKESTVRLLPIDVLSLSLLDPLFAHRPQLSGQTIGSVTALPLIGSGYTALYLRNASERIEALGTLSCEAEENFYRLNIEQGDLVKIEDIEENEKRVVMTISLLPQQSCFLVASAAKLPCSVPKNMLASLGTPPRNYRIVLKDQWQFSVESLNVLPLTTWSTRIGLSRETGGYSHIYETYFDVRSLPDVCGLMVSQLSGGVGSQYDDRSLYEISINGTKIEQSLLRNMAAEGPAALRAAGYLGKAPYVKGLTTYNVLDLLRKGVNRIAIRTAGGVGAPPAIVYPPLIAGDFHISKGAQGWVIGKEMPESIAGSWSKHGFAYFSGVGRYSQVFEIPSDYNRLVLRFAGVSGRSDIYVNKKPLGTFIWQPIEIDVTETADTKRCDLDVYVYNTVENILRLNGRQSGMLGEVHLDVY